MKVSCVQCKWFFTDGQPDGGYCRRLPPTASQDGDTALFPQVRNNWFCGEFAPQPWHPSQGEPDRNAPGYGLILHMVKQSQAKNTATRAANKAKQNGATEKK